jgi:DNA-binding transcriptional MerR regulator
MSEENTQNAFNIPEAIESIDTVPEKFRSLYVEKGGKFVFQDPAVLARSMENAKKEREEYRKRAASVEKWERLGKSPDEIAELLSAQQKAEEEKHLKAGEWEKVKANMLEQHEKALKAKDEEVARMRATIDNRLIAAEATRAIAEMKGVPDLLLPHVQRQTKVVQDDSGEYVARVIDNKGEYRSNAKGEYLTIQDLVAEMRESTVFGRAFEGTGAGGSGAPVKTSSAGGGNKKRSEMSAAEKAAYIGQHGKPAYDTLPW